MYIKNKKTGVVQECHNKDVIKTCRKDVEHFEVTKEKPTDQEVVSEEKAVEMKFEDMNTKTLRALAKEKGLEGYNSLNKDELLEILKDVV